MTALQGKQIAFGKPAEHQNEKEGFMERFSIQNYELLLAAAGQFHGDICPGIQIGTRMMICGLQNLGIDDPKGADRKKLIVFVEIDRCATDAIMVLTGCKPGKRTMKVRDYGKMAATMRVLMQMVFSFLFYVLLSFHCLAQPGMITTVAGSDSPANINLAAMMRLSMPGPVAPDGVGGFYVSDQHKNRIYHVTSDGRHHLVVGAGICGYSGDGGKAVSAQVCSPAGVAVDSAGNLFIADNGNHRIRKVTPAGVITTVAGNGTRGISGDGGPAASAQLANPISIAVDSSDNLYIADKENSRIRKVTPAGVIVTIAGKGDDGYSGDGGPATSAQLANPQGVAVDSTGNLYLADTVNYRIRKVTPAGLITTVAGNGACGFGGDGGPAISAPVCFPTSVAVDFAGNLFIASPIDPRIRKVTPAGVITTIAGNQNHGDKGDGGPAVSAVLNGPNAVATDSAGNLYVTDFGNSRIRKITPAGLITSAAGVNRKGLFTGDGGKAASVPLTCPRGVAVDSAGNLYIADPYNHHIRKATPVGLMTIIAGNGIRGFSGDGGKAVSAQLDNPQGVAVDSTGNLYIADMGNHRIRKVTSAGVITTVVRTQKGGFIRALGILAGMLTGDPIYVNGDGPQGVAVDSLGNIYIAEIYHCRVRKVTPAGKITTIAGNGIHGYSGDGGKAVSAHLGSPYDVAIDSAGNLYIADTHNACIRKVTPAGKIATIAGNGIHGYSGDGSKAVSAQLAGPQGVAVDSSGNLYIADTRNDRIRKVTPDGLITTVAGNGNEGCDGDGGPATSAQLNWPSGIAVDSAGNLFIADTDNDRIRKVIPF
jgi:trimeric autotransporter adhesin